jgi:ubiquinol-cytochrome c reductase cytochrome b subunit
MGEKKEKKPLGQRLRARADETVTAIAAGLSIQDLRDMFRGEPAGRPNPRYRVHNVSFWFHLKPRWYPRSVTKFTYTLALGWSSAFLAVVLGVTGFILMIFYTPSTDAAYFSMLNIIGNVSFGNLMRDVHRLSAELMVASVVLHMLRVFVTGSYKAPRSFNWLVGMTLLFITLAFSFSGYLLPWDQLSYWAITIGTGIADAIPVIGGALQRLLLGGAEVGQLGLLRFYTLHVIVLPIALAIMFAVHYHKIVRQGISLPPSLEAGGERESDRVSFLPDVLVREAMWGMLFLLAILLAATIFFNAPLEDHANPFVTPLHATAPWYFLWLQGLIKLPDFFGGIVEGKLVYGLILPGIFFTILFALPYLDRNPSRRWQDRKLALGIAAVVILALAVLTWMGSPAYKVQASPAEEVALEFVPVDRHGAIDEVPWEQLIDGSYDTTTFSQETLQRAARLERFMLELQKVVGQEKTGLPGGVATLTITTWQRDLKRVDLDIVWQEGGQQQSFNQYTYIHVDAARH